jgi:methylated-DNA-protein-cysteine methyltransferase-like protein
MKRYRNIGSKDYSVYQEIYGVVGQIPKGKVATYGQVARVVGRITARMVGYAMAALRGRTDVPWQRVINYKGEISARAHGDGSTRQRKLLMAEGIRFDSKGRVDFKKVRWNGPENRREERGTKVKGLME